MKKLKHEAELFKAALQAGVDYAEGRKAVQFEPTDSASAKALYVYRLLVHDNSPLRDFGRTTPGTRPESKRTERGGYLF